MKNFSLLVALVSLSATAQTRLISHKSHSGSMATFNTALENNLFDIGASNFGEPPSEPRFVIDSVILQPDNSAIIIASEKEMWITYPEYTFPLTGRDTLYNDPLLSKRHAEDSIKRELWRQSITEPVLINYDNKTKKNTIPVMPNDNNGTPNIPLMVAALALISILLGAAFYMLHKVKTIKLA